MLTLEQILEDLKTYRVKKVILDSDMANEMDDPYALAHCIGSEKIDLLSVNAAPYHEDGWTTHSQGMENSYNLTIDMLERFGKNDGSIPVYHGSDRQFTPDDGFAPIDSPAARNIIKTVKEAHEIIYVLGIGCCSNVVSAYLLDPSIADNMCFIWLGGHLLENDHCNEFNLRMDYYAGQILTNSNIPLILLPAAGVNKERGTQVLVINFPWLDTIKGDKPFYQFLRRDFPISFIEGDVQAKIPVWKRILWDVAAPGLITHPEAFVLHKMPVPVFGDDRKYSFDQTRRKVLIMEKLDKDIVLTDCAEAISNL